MARKSIDWMKTMPELLNEWNYEKNNIMPSDISIWSKNKAASCMRASYLAYLAMLLAPCACTLDTVWAEECVSSDIRLVTASEYTRYAFSC